MSLAPFRVHVHGLSLNRSSPISTAAPFRLQGAPEDGLADSGGTEADDRWGDRLAAAQRGDADAYRAFLIAITPFVRALLHRRGWADDRIEDVVQDVLLTVHRVRHTYEPGRPVRPWLAAIVVRRSIDALRKAGRIGAREVHDPLAIETYADPGANREQARDAARTLARMTETLTPGQKEALDLVKVKEMSLVEASAASGQSVAALKVNVHRALKKLRRAWKGRPE